MSEKGGDVVNGYIQVKGHRLYEVVNLKKSGNGILQLIPSLAGLGVYTFTFGN